MEHKFGLEIQNFGQSVLSGAMVVIVTGDEAHTAYPFSSYFEKKSALMTTVTSTDIL